MSASCQPFDCAYVYQLVDGTVKINSDEAPEPYRLKWHNQTGRMTSKVSGGSTWDFGAANPSAASKTQIAFAYGSDIWIVSRAGGAAHRLVTGTGLLSGPHFSPDGSLVAYTGDYDGNLDVYVVSAEGGQPRRRLTYHAGRNVAVGWTPDGKSVLFRSHRFS